MAEAVDLLLQHHCHRHHHSPLRARAPPPDSRALTNNHRLELELGRDWRLHGAARAPHMVRGSPPPVLAPWLELCSQTQLQPALYR
jgi:hypothetical protein